MNSRFLFANPRAVPDNGPGPHSCEGRASDGGSVHDFPQFLCLGQPWRSPDVSPGSRKRRCRRLRLIQSEYPNRSGARCPNAAPNSLFLAREWWCPPMFPYRAQSAGLFALSQWGAGTETIWNWSIYSSPMPGHTRAGRPPEKIVAWADMRPAIHAIVEPSRRVAWNAPE